MPAHKPLAEIFWSKVRQGRNTECWDWQAALKNGYGQIMVNGKNMCSHRVAYELTFGEIPNGLCVCHHCDNPKCCNPNHLFLGTQKENMVDALSKGRIAIKLSTDDVERQSEQCWNLDSRKHILLNDLVFIQV